MTLYQILPPSKTNHHLLIGVWFEIDVRDLQDTTLLYSTVWQSEWQSGMWSCIMPGLYAPLVQELNVGTVTLTTRYGDKCWSDIIPQSHPGFIEVLLDRALPHGGGQVQMRAVSLREGSPLVHSARLHWIRVTF